MHVFVPSFIHLKPTKTFENKGYDFVNEITAHDMSILVILESLNKV